MLKINGVAVAAPSTYEVSITDIDGESNRNANGNLVRDRIAVKRELTLEWLMLTQEEMSILLNAVSNVFFNCEFIDPQNGRMTKTMYVSDRNAPAFQMIKGEMRWSSLKMNFVEK